jgi:hypothetical protein
MDDLIPETVSELEGAISIALSHRKGWTEAKPEVIDFVANDNQKWRAQGYIWYRNVKLYGHGMKAESDERSLLTSEQAVFGHSKSEGPPNPYAAAPRKIEGIDN